MARTNEEIHEDMGLATANFFLEVLAINSSQAYQDLLTRGWFSVPPYRYYVDLNGKITKNERID